MRNCGWRGGGGVIGVFSRERRDDGRVGLLGLALGKGRYRDMGFAVHCGYAQVMRCWWWWMRFWGSGIE